MLDFHFLFSESFRCDTKKVHTICIACLFVSKMYPHVIKIMSEKICKFIYSKDIINL